MCVRDQWMRTADRAIGRRDFEGRHAAATASTQEYRLNSPNPAIYWRGLAIFDINCRMNKQEAAKFLGVSVRALERYTQQGRISARYEKGRTRPIVTYDENELREFKTALESKLYKPVVEPRNTANSASGETALVRLSENSVPPDASAGVERLIAALEALGLHRQERQQIAAPVEHKLLLTLKEAQALTGLSRAILREAIEAGELKAKLIGKAWRVRRTDLEIFVKKL